MRTRTATSLMAIVAFAWIASSKPGRAQSTEFTAGGIAYDACVLYPVSECTITVWNGGVSQSVAGGMLSGWSPDGNRVLFFGTSDDIFVVNVGDLSVVNVTNHPALDMVPAWSPDGSRIAFLSDRTGTRELYSVNHDGTDLVSLTNALGPINQFAWSPTGSTIAINRAVDGTTVLDRINSDGSNLVRLTSGEGFIGGFGWSPAGNTIAFVRQVQGVWDLYTMNSDGSNVVRLTAGEFTGGVTWSPDGSRIAFDCGPQVCAINADGTGLVHLATGASAVFAPAGDRIAFRTDFGQGPEIVVREQNAAIVRVAPNISVYAGPIWSPDGTSILFNRPVPSWYLGCCTELCNGDQPPCEPVFHTYVASADGSGIQATFQTSAPGLLDWFRPRAGQPLASFNALCTGSTCVFDASRSSDSNGSIATHNWTFGDGTIGSGSTVTHTYTVSGSHRVALTVLDNDGLTSTVGGTFFTNAPPVAAFTSACTGGVCTFNASQSADPDGSIFSYSWEFGDGAVASDSSSIVTHGYVSGTFTVGLTVRDNHHAVATASVTVQVVNPPPVASFESSCTLLICNFDATASQDDGTIAWYAWDFGDGQVGYGAVMSHTYAAAGKYTVLLRLADLAGQQATATESVAAVRGLMHVGDLDGYADPGPQGSILVHVTVTVHDKDHQPVANVAVSGSWSSGGTGVCTTNAAGHCDVWGPPMQGGQTRTFQITSLTHAMYDYQPSSNHDPDGDSTGTTIQVRRH